MGEVLAAKVTAGLAVVLGLVVMAWGAYSVSVLTIAVSRKDPTTYFLLQTLNHCTSLLPGIL